MVNLRSSSVKDGFKKKKSLINNVTIKVKDPLDVKRKLFSKKAAGIIK